MKQLMLKIRNRRLKGNISLLVIFILLASSVIALLSINQIQHLLTYWNMTFNYFRAFYLAKAWTELWLTEVYYREAWFENMINSWDSVITENLVWIYTWFDPHFTMNISWNFLYLTDDVRYTDGCDSGNRIVLGTWEGVVLSLFKDSTSSIQQILTWTNESNIKRLSNDEIEQLKMDDVDRVWWWSKYFMFWLFDYDNNWDMWSIVVKTWADLNNFLNSEINNVGGIRRYLSIKNPWTWNEIVSFCILSNDGKLIPYTDSLITVRGNYADMEVWLQSVVKRQTPSWSINVLWDN